MAKIVSSEIAGYHQHYPRIAAVVTAQARGKENAMAVAWHCPLSHSPPIFGVSISPKRFTYGLILESREFGVNFLPLEKAEVIAAVGGSKGAEVDKFQKYSIAKEKPIKTSVPLLKDAYASFECRLLEHRTYGDHELMIGEILAVHLAEGILTPQETLDLFRVSPALYIGADFYVTTDKKTVRYIERPGGGERR